MATSSRELAKLAAEAGREGVAKQKALEAARQDDVNSVVAEEVCGVIPAGAYALRRVNRTWDVNGLVKREDALAHLSKTLGLDPVATKKALEGFHCAVAYGADTLPNAPDVVDVDGRPFLNNWVLPTIEPKEGNWSSIEKILKVVTAGDEAGYRWVLNWCAAKVQRPGARNMTAIVFMGSPGSGK